MVLLTHIIIAIASVVYTTFLLINPTQMKLKTSYLLVLATLASGTYLTILNPDQLMRTCLAGLVYVSLVTLGIAIARQKLRLTEAKDRSLSSY